MGKKWGKRERGVIGEREWSKAGESGVSKAGESGVSGAREREGESAGREASVVSGARE